MLGSLFTFIRLIFQQKNLIVRMARREVATKHVGSLLGFLWTFINPIVIVFVFWLIFSIGFRVQPLKDVPFVVWFAAGLAVWFVFSDAVNGSVFAVVTNANLIKKTMFPSQILPIIKLVSCVITHSVFLLVLLVLIIFLRMPFNIFYLQFAYYLLCALVLSLGLGWAVAALNVFVRDVGQVVALALQIGFWVTPVFWDINIMPPKLQVVFKLNPMFYVVQGYRDSFIYFVPFWEHPYQTLYFWGVAIAMFGIGALIFKKLKPQFADVL